MTESQIRDQCNALADLLVKKNHDYGDAALRSPILAPHFPAELSIVIRMSDKIERMRHFISLKETLMVSESFDDTVRDLAGYCVLLLALRSKE